MLGLMSFIQFLNFSCSNIFLRIIQHHLLNTTMDFKGKE